MSEQQTIESRTAHKRTTGRWPKHPDVVEIPDPPAPPKINIYICLNCNEPLRPNPTYGTLTGTKDDSGLPKIDSESWVCRLCGFGW